jgi:GT2 family glycosyltransferase
MPYVPAFLGLKPFFCSVHPKFWYSAFDEEAEQEVEVVRGAFMFVRREVLDKLGFGFDPNYFLLFEDIDLCQEVKKLGYQVVYTPKISCVDYFGRSFAHETKPWKYLQMVRSFKLYLKKWHSPGHRVWVSVLSVWGFLIRIPRWGVRSSANALKNYFAQI